MKGGAGSGNFEHEGRPGEVGGSATAIIPNIDYSDDPNHFVGRFQEVMHQFEAAKSRPELQKTKKSLLDESKVPDGVILYFFKKNLDRFRSTDIGRTPAEARADRVLRIRDSTGKAIARKR